MLEDAGPDRGPQPLRHRQHPGRPPLEPGAQGERHVQEGHRLHRQGREGRHHRRVHRPDDGRAALVGRPSPGGRGQGRRPDRAREPDARLDHLPELFPHVPEAVGHDRHGDDRSAGILRHLQDERGRRSRPTCRSCAIDEDDEFYKNDAGEVRGDRQGDQGEAGASASRCWSAPSRSRSRRCCPNISTRKASSTRC